MKIIGKKARILIVDDEPNILESLERLFRKDYHLILCETPEEALATLRKEKISLLLCDQRMPRMEGTEVLAEASKIQPRAVRIMLTGYSDIEALIEAINKGHIYRYITKPWDPQDLKLTVQRALESYQMQEDLDKKRILLEKSHKTLKKAYRELQTLDRAKDAFIALVSHELRTPLTSLIAYTESLRSEDLPASEHKKAINRIWEASQRLHLLIQRVIRLTDATSGRLKLSLQTFQLEELIQSCVQKMEGKKKNIKWFMDLPTCAINADPQQLGEVFLNLLENSLRFTPEGGTISLSAKLTPPKAPKHINLSLEDNGPGVEKKYWKKAFEKFVLIEDIHEHTRGLGLGLPLAKIIVEAHGGTIDFVKPRTQQGTHIRIRFPLSGSRTK